MAKKTIFISYDYDNDRNYKNLLLAWNENNLFPFSFKDGSADVSIKSNDEATIKRAISAKINENDYFLCIVGENTILSDWVSWEIDKAVDLGKKIIAVKIAKDNITPIGLYCVGAKWALSFNFDAIKKAVDEA